MHLEYDGICLVTPDRADDGIDDDGSGVLVEWTTSRGDLDPGSHRYSQARLVPQNFEHSIHEAAVAAPRLWLFPNRVRAPMSPLC